MNLATTLNLPLEVPNDPFSTDWAKTGNAFAGSSSRRDVQIGESLEQPIARFISEGVDSGRLALPLEGELRSPTFTLDKDYLHFMASGHGCRISLMIDGFYMITAPIYGGLILHVDSGKPTWMTIDVRMWKGQRAYIELADSATALPTATPPIDEVKTRPGNGYLHLDRIVASNEAAPLPEGPSTLLMKREKELHSVEDLAKLYQSTILESLDDWRVPKTQGSSNGAQAEILNGLLEKGLLDGDPAQKAVFAQPKPQSLALLLRQYRSLSSGLPPPGRALALADGTGEDESVFLRGNYRTPGDRAPRKLPDVCGGQTLQVVRGSGRLELARRLVDPSNPLLARVMVNRVWLHHFGKGIVSTPDDFGHMGEKPTHPELLDYLASEFIRQGWSLKKLHRMILLSRTYRMSGQVDPVAQQKDPQDKYLHHMPLRRLEAEAVRDSILAVSGSLNRRMFGPSVLPYLTSFMEGRGRPPVSGPLDGDGRRSIYINVRRNFLTPMFLAFDYPIPFTTIGRRSSSNVPAQALALMNDPFVVQEASRWAKRLLTQKNLNSQQRIRQLYETAFARLPTSEELKAALNFLSRQETLYGNGPDDSRAWADLCHVLFNVKEFIFIR
jgi:hypothetical protein